MNAKRKRAQPNKREDLLFKRLLPISIRLVRQISCTYQRINSDYHLETRDEPD